MVTKACHLEIVTDLSSEAFIAALKRFFSRRGKSERIFSDNATNFVGTQLELKRLREIMSNCVSNLSKFLCEEHVEWSFIPPRAPNHGGLWEAGVKAVKYHLRRVMGNLRFTYEEFLTILNQIEVVLNPLSSAAVAEWYRHRIVAGFVTSSSPVPLKTRRVGQRCKICRFFPLVWCGNQTSLTMVQNYVVRRQKPF
ncbi:integrase catalytic domain-containing protein [Trichonephila clavipes]|nr:integrase catalytic domain-containing protein [Trichonephila clavipes]